MRKLKIDENKLKEYIEHIVYESLVGVRMNELNGILKNNGINVSPQIVRRNVIKLIKEKKIKLNKGKLEYGN